MKFWLGVTDNGWYEFLAKRGLDELNFWQPSATPPFVGAPMGLPFLFKLKSPNNHVAGGGFFVTYSRLPISLAWEVFGAKNGVPSLDALRSTTGRLGRSREEEQIGCTVLANPFFLPRELWIANPPGWSSNIVRGKMYDADLAEGKALWDTLNLRFRSANPMAADDVTEMKYGPPVLVKPRLGQSSFRVLVTDAYERRCAITGENTLLALEAAHIVPYAGLGSHDVRNGLLLRADFHRLFDAGLIGVTPDLRVRVSPRIREAYFNGKAYYRMHDQPLSVVPSRPHLCPDPDGLDWHMRNRFQA